MNAQRTVAPYVGLLGLAVLLLALGGLGWLVFLAFVTGILIPGEFASYGLVLTTVAAATASFFSPCSFVVLPSYIAFASSGEEAGPEGRLLSTLKTGAIAALGVVTAVTVLGAVIGLLGTGIGPQLSIASSTPNPLSRSLRIIVGVLVFFMGFVHLVGLSHRLPLLGRIASWAPRAQVPGRPSAWSVYTYGAGYVFVGIG